MFQQVWGWVQVRGKLASDRYHLGWAGQGFEGLGLVSPRKASPLLFSTGSWSPAKSADCRATNSWSILRSGIGPPRWPMEDAGPRKRRPHARSGDLTLQGLLQLGAARGGRAENAVQGFLVPVQYILQPQRHGQKSISLVSILFLY